MKNKTAKHFNFIILRSEEALTFNKDNNATFSCEKKKKRKGKKGEKKQQSEMKLPGVSIFWECEKELYVKLRI